MRFVLCARDPLSGVAALVGGQAYATRTEATEALTVQGSLSGLEGRDLYLVDLDAATPVVVVTPAGAATAGPEPSTTEPAAVCAAPASAEEWPFLTPGVAGGVGPSTLTADRVEDEADLASVWWLEAGIVEQTAPAPSDEGPDTVVPAEVDSGGSQTDADSPTAAPESEAQETQTLDVAEPITPESSGDASPEASPMESAEPTAETLAGETMTEAEHESIPEEATAAKPEGGPVLTVDFDVWTCSDCIFVTTCPQSGSGRPATCGSFQWRPE